MTPIKIRSKIVSYSVSTGDASAQAEIVSKTDAVAATKPDAAAAASQAQPSGAAAGTSGAGQATAAPGSGTATSKVAEPAFIPMNKDNVIHMHEKVGRPEMLEGSTYKVKTPVSDHAMYVTINDIILNAGTEYEKRRPFEIFINSKNLDHYQWIVALTRIISAVFRKGGDVTFLVDELKAVFDPRGGYWKPGGVYMPSIIAELGHVVEEHLQKIGLLKKPGLDEHQQKLIDEKRAEYEELSRQKDAFAEGGYPAGAQLCTKCSTAAVVMLDGCKTCLSCGDSKCG